MSEKVCGTGSGNFPQPGDPDLNNSILNAAPAFGGIDVFWTYPNLNAHAVAHTILYRSTNPDPATRVKLRTVSGEFYYDKVDPSKGITYYYWIQIVSVNGTVGDFIGPASAMARPTIEQTIEMLSGQITEGALGQALKGEINRIESLNADLNAETAERLLQYDQLQTDLAAYQSDVDGVATLLASEVARLEDDDTAQINQINVLSAKTSDNEAAIVSEQEARAGADEALAKAYDTLKASSAQTFYQTTAPDPAAVTLNEHDIWVDTTEPADGSEPTYTQYQWDGSQWVEAPAETLAGVFAAVEAERMARVNRDGAVASRVEVLEAAGFQDSDDVSAAIEAYDTARVGYCMINGSPSSSIGSKSQCQSAGGTWLDMHAIATAVKGVQITDNKGQTANVEQRMRTYKDDLGELQGEYTVKIQSDSNGNKIAGGFGLATAGQSVEAGFDVDRFWVGKLGNKRYPFIIDGQEVFIDEAVIRELTFNKLRADDGSLIVKDGKIQADYLSADNLVSEVTVNGGPAYAFRENGTFELNGADSTGSMKQTPSRLDIRDGSGNLRVRLGKL